MSLYARFAGNVLFPLQEAVKKHSTQSVLRSLERSQWLSPEQLQSNQALRLRDFLTEIGRTVPYYRDLFRTEGFEPASVTDLCALQRLPFLTKSLIRQHTEALKAEGAKGLQRFNTGGSSGEPLIFYLGRTRVSHDVAAKRRATRWWGVDIGDPEIVIWGSPIELGAQDRLRQWRDMAFRTELLSAFEMSQENLDHFLQRIRHKKPRMLFGYPSALAHIAQHAGERGIRLDNLGIQVVFVTSETLYDYQRYAIEGGFGCPVANGYGGRDAGFIAHECPSGSLHISAEDIIVEVIRSDGSPADPGETGELVVTHMATPEFPFVRYRMGDVGTLSDAMCTCGRGLPILADIQGRTTDLVVARDGTVMHGLSLIYVLRDMPGVGEFKIVQESPELTRVFVRADPGWGASDVRHIQEQFRRRLGESVDIEVIETAEIPPEHSGKRRYVVSKVNTAPSR